MADSGGGFITGFLFGGIVGAAFGLLLAPKPGQETRNELRNQSESRKINILHEFLVLETSVCRARGIDCTRA